jgi:hypothetical protein
MAAAVLLPAGIASGQGASTSAKIEIRPGIPPKEGAAISADETSLEEDAQLRQTIELFEADSSSLDRTYPLRLSLARQARLGEFYSQYLSLLDKLGGRFDQLSQAGKIDYLLLKSHIEHDVQNLEQQVRRRDELTDLIPFAATIIDAEEARRRLDPIDGKQSAEMLAALTKQTELAHKRLEAALANRGDSKNPPPGLPSKLKAFRTAAALDRLRDALKNWHRFYHDYDPVFTWWTGEPFKAADSALEKYANLLREKVVGIKAGDETAIFGDAIGKEAMLAELRAEWIPYEPDELIAIAEKEFAWCEAEMKKAAEEMGCQDWKEALEKVKNDYVPPGEQPQLIRQLAQEAIDFLEQRDLVTIPPLAKETWRMEMMSRERQLVTPFFTGGEVISVAFPTAGMSHEQKLMTLRGNNRHFARATVHHELIPGHRLQAYMLDRHRPYRDMFGTPFWMEGWALYWEMLLWDLDFAKSPENKVGMLFWRSHRCARIIFSMKFHLGQMTPQECVDFLVDRVGHERANAEGEVRRSINGSYGPTYQAAYMLGGLQIRAMYKELVGSGKLTNRQFHDAVLKEGSIPIELIRASLTGQKLTKDFRSEWKFYGEGP